MRATFALCLFLAATCQAQSFDFAHAAGGSSPDGAYGCALDGAGNLFVAGNFSGTIDLDPGPALSMHTSGDMGLFVAKYSPAGALVWARTITPQAGMHVGCEDMTIDAAGNVYAAGAFNGTVDFDPGASVQSRTALDVFNIASPNNSFVLKLDAAGNFGWVSTFRGDANIAACIAVAASGNVHVGGLFNLDMDVETGAGNVIITALGSYFNAYLVTLNANGGHLWNVAYNSPVGESVADLEVDSFGSVYTCGSFIGTVDFDPNGAMPATTTTGYVDAYVARYSSTGTLQWLRHYGAPSGNGNIAEGLYREGNDLYVVGTFKNSIDFDHGAGAATLTSSGGENGFVLKLDVTGAFGWARGLHGAGDVHPRGVTGDGTNLWVSGGFLGSADFDPGAGAATLDASSGGNGFVVGLTGAGAHAWSANFGTTHTTTGTGGTFPATAISGMAGSGGRVAVCGSFFNTGQFGSFSFNSAGLGDAFFAVLETVTTPGALQITSPPPASATVNTAAGATFAATGGSGAGYQWSLVSGTLPTGISGLPGAGTPSITLSGVPTVLGAFTFRLRVQDDTGASAERTYTWTVQTLAAAGGAGTGAGIPGTGCVATAAGAWPALVLLAPLLWRRRRAL